MQYNFGYPVTEKRSCDDIRGEVEKKIDPGPTDDSGEDVKDETIFGKPVGQKSGHHKCVGGMGARKPGVNHLRPGLRKRLSHCQNLKRPWPADEMLQAVNRPGQNPAEEEKDEDDFFSSYNDTTDGDEDKEGIETSKVSEPGNDLIEKRRRPPPLSPFHES
jgi:hypothetical protein